MQENDVTMKNNNTTTTADNTAEAASLLWLDPYQIQMPPEAEAVPILSLPQWNALVNSIAEQGIRSALVVCRAADGGYTLLDGRHRLSAAIELGLPQVPVRLVEAPAEGLLGREIVALALLTRELPRAGRAALVLEIHPELLARNGAVGCNNLPDPAASRNRVGPNGHSVAISRNPIEKPAENDISIRQIAEKFGLHREYLSAVIQARLECRPDTLDWEDLRARLMDGPIGAARILSTLRGIQSGGAHAATKVPGRAGTDVSNLARRTAVSLGTAWEHWRDVNAPCRQAFLSNWAKAIPTMPPEAVELLAEGARQWQPHVRQRLLKALREVEG